jgi:outer membrane protein assembly factor BamB
MGVRKWWIRTVAGAFAAALAAAQITPGQAGATWTGDPLASYDAGAAYSFENTVPFAAPIWTVNIGKPSEGARGEERIAIGNGRFYRIQDGKLIAADLKTGKTLWKYGANLRGLPLLAGGDVYAAAADGKVHRVSGSTGRAVRVYSFGLKPAAQDPQPVHGLSVAGDALYVLSAKGLYSIDAATGRQNWLSDGFLPYETPRIIGDIALVPAVESGAITVTTFYAIDRKTGKMLWRLEGSHEGPLAVWGDRLYFRDTWPPSDSTRYAAQVDAVDLRSGQIVESYPLVPIPDGADPLSQYARKVVMDGRDAYVEASDGSIYRYDLNAGPAAVPPAVFRGQGAWIAGPYDGKLFFRKQDGIGLYAVKMFDRTTVDYPGLDNPVSRLDLIGSGMVVGQTDGEIYVVNVGTARALFRFQTSARSFGPFRVAGNALLVTAEDKLYAFRLPAELLQGERDAGASNPFRPAQAGLKVNGAEKPFQPGAMTSGNRLFVPLRFLSETVGAEVSYDNRTGEAAVVYRGRTVSLKEGASYAVSGGRQTALTYPAVNVRGVLYVPLRDIGSLLGFEVVWNDAERTVEVSTGG